MNYRRGYIAELRAKEELERAGYLVLRTAGSKGPCDLVAVKEGEVLFVQVKRTKSRGTTKEGMQEVSHVPSGTAVVRREVWVWVDRKGWRKEICS